ncbi:hypothetical protein JNJ66_07780 [Candidatus Saccharibacteria bacterium]|nr:hypothetical protein [Candidatus Saccharibacteria bacterium]
MYVSERRWQRLQNALHDKQTPREKMLTLLKTSDDFEHEVLGCRLIHFDEPRLDIFLGDDRRLYMVGTIGQRHFPLVRRHHIEQLSDEQFTRVLTSIGSA